MAPKQAQRGARKKGPHDKEASGSGHQVDPTEEPEVYTHAPWPRREKELFVGDMIPAIPNFSKEQFVREARFKKRQFGVAWERHNSIVYNGFTHMNIMPTKLICLPTLRKMGIEKDVLDMFEKIGLGKLGMQHEPLYPELVRQFLSSVDVVYDDVLRVASQGRLGFLIRGKHYDMTIRDLCDVYGFDNHPERVTIPINQVELLWKHVGSGSGPSKYAKLTMVRNPVIRIMSRFLGNLFLGSLEAGSMTQEVAALLHMGLPDLVFRGIMQPPDFDVNMGAVFADMLFERRFRAIRNPGKKIEHIGNLLTPIFKWHGIDLSGTECNEAIHLMDETYMKNMYVLKDHWKYQFTMPDEEVRFLQLPRPELTSPRSLQHAAFLFRGDAPAYESSSSEDSPIAPQHDTGSSSAPIQYLLPEYAGEYDPAPIAADATDSERLKWLVEDIPKRHAMSTKIWNALAKIPLPRCLRAPDVAGHRSTDGERVGRARREPGQSRSQSPART